MQLQLSAERIHDTKKKIYLYSKVVEQWVNFTVACVLGVSQCPPDHEYALTSSSHDNKTPLETVEIGIQTDLGMAEMTELLNIKEKTQNPDAVLRELFTNKVTANDKSVKKYTGLPSKSMLNGLYGKFVLSQHF